MTVLRPPPSPPTGGAAAAWTARVGGRLSDPRLLRWCSLVCVVAVLALVGSGAWVRLSSSGLGCPTWPNCTAHAVVAPDRYHALVEFVNRCIITAVGVLVGATALLSFARRPKRADLRWLAAGLLAGYVGEAVLGGLTVLLKLAPALVASHLVLALLILSDAVVLHHRTAPAGSARRPAGAFPAVGREVRWLCGLVLMAVGGGIVVGTVVTGSGPHSGSPGTPRFHFSFSAVAHVHAVMGMFGFGVFVALWVLLRVQRVPTRLRRRADAVLALMALQGALGYATFFTTVQVDVAEVHVLGGALLLASLVALQLGLAAPGVRRPTGAIAAPPGTPVAGGPEADPSAGLPADPSAGLPADPSAGRPTDPSTNGSAVAPTSAMGDHVQS